MTMRSLGAPRRDRRFATGDSTMMPWIDGAGSNDCGGASDASCSDGGGGGD